MRFILVLIFCLCSAVAVSQARVGVHITEVINEFPVEEINDSVYAWKTQNAVVKYITDSLGFVSETIIYPLSLRDEKIYVSYYNNAFEKHGNSRWVFKLGDDSCFITKVRKGDSQSCYFIWSDYNGIKRSYNEELR